MTNLKKIILIMRALKEQLKYILGISLSYRPAAEQYPDMISARSAMDLFPKTRGFLKNDLDTCTGCGDCIKACPVHALSMDSEVANDGKVEVKKYSIDLGRCYFCSVCVEICPVNSLTHSKEYELAPNNPQDMIMTFVPDNTREKIGLKILRDKRIRSYEVRR
jgi:formate hydrogenlyase subunit 6/NADH:ubiquinone oxidoreductase subunit I